MKKLRRKLIFVVMLSLSLVLLFLVGTVNGLMVHQLMGRSDSLLRMLAQNEGRFPDDFGRPNGKPEEKMGLPDEKTGGVKEQDQMEPGRKVLKEKILPDLGQFGFSSETPFETRYFSVTYQNGQAENVDVSHIAAITAKEAKEYGDKIIGSGKNSGISGSYRYLLSETEEETRVIFVDCGNDLRILRNFAAASVLVAALCLMLVFILVTALSKRAVWPVMEGMEKQKQFITDAGHELKTPIAIISADTEVIEMCTGESEWTRSIHHQVQRMTELVQNLLTLARMEESDHQETFAEFDCSEVIREAAGAFESVAKTRALSFATDIPEGLRLLGSKKNIGRMMTLLVDNAVKYADEGGKVRVRCAKKGKNMELEVYNSSSNLPEGDLNRLFDRFYRTDVSRSRESGGYGIGLSVVQAIVRQHKGKIQAVREEEGIAFRVSLPGIR